MGGFGVGSCVDVEQGQLQTVVRLASDVRVRRAFCEQKWVIEQVARRRCHKIGQTGLAGAVLTLSAMKEQTARELADGVGERFGVDPVRVLVLIDQLLDEGILVQAQGAGRLPEPPEQRSAWYYHHGTYDFPFARYDENFESRDNMGLMNRYRRERPDVFRCKQMRNGAVDVAGSRSSVRNLDLGPACGYFNSAQQEVRLERLLWLLTAKVGEIKIQGEDCEPLVLRTSPSGGSRHQTETYVAYVKGEQFETPSFHHCQIDPAGLVSLPVPENRCASSWADFGDVSPSNDYDEVFYLLFTTMYERYMYRYREPRAFRVIFLDAGHLAMTAARIFENCGYRLSVSLALNQDRIGEWLELKQLDESGIAVIRAHKEKHE